MTARSDQHDADEQAVAQVGLLGTELFGGESRVRAAAAIVGDWEKAAREDRPTSLPVETGLVEARHGLADAMDEAAAVYRRYLRALGEYHRLLGGGDLAPAPAKAPPPPAKDSLWRNRSNGHLYTVLGLATNKDPDGLVAGTVVYTRRHPAAGRGTDYVRGVDDFLAHFTPYPPAEPDDREETP
jgi:hypothetical protein